MKKTPIPVFPNGLALPQDGLVLPDYRQPVGADDPIALTPALVAMLKPRIEAKLKADAEFNLVHQTICAGLGVNPAAWTAIDVGDDGSIRLRKQS